MTQRTCKECGNLFPETTEFFRQYNDRGKMRFRAQCHRCERLKNLKYERTRVRDVDQYKTSQKVYRDREDNRQVANTRAKRWRQDHPEQAKANVDIWVAAHSDRVRELHRRYQLERRRSDPQFAVLCRLRNRLRKAFQRYSIHGKVKPSREYGIDYVAIFEHLGPCPGEGWEIDHIIPLALFDLDDPEQVRQAFAPRNHQWLLKSENIKKGKRLTICANDHSGRSI